MQARKYRHKQDLHGCYLATKFIEKWTSGPQIHTCRISMELLPCSEIKNHQLYDKRLTLSTHQRMPLLVFNNFDMNANAALAYICQY